MTDIWARAGKSLRESRSFALSYIMILTYVFIAVLLCVVQVLDPEGTAVGGKIWILLIVASASFCVGGVGGFLYAPFQGEAYKLSDVLGLFSVGAGGLAVGDLFRENNSLLVRIARDLAESAGLQGGEAFVCTVAACFLPLGFLNLYIFKRVYLNPAIAFADVTAVEEARRAMEQEMASLMARVDIEASELTVGKPVFSDTVKRDASTLVERWDLLAIKTPDDHAAYAKALCVLEKPDEALTAIEQALRKCPGNTTLLLNEAMIRIAYLPGDYQAIIRLLLTTAKSYAARSLTWKLLGYAYLKQQTADYQAAEHFTSIYVRLQESLCEKDAGALFNLACCYAGQGKAQEAVAWLDQARVALPYTPGLSGVDIKARVGDLLKSHFARIKGESDFRQWFDGSHVPANDPVQD